MSTSLGFTMWSVCATPLAAAYGLAGRSSDAARVLADPRVEPGSNSGSLAESYLLGGYLDEASRLAEQELDLARAQKSRAQEARALHVLGELAACRDPFDVEAGEDYLRQAVVLAGDLGMRPLVAHCHLGFGKLHGRAGKREQAREHLATATTMYREMDMKYWLEQVAAETAALG